MNIFGLIWIFILAFFLQVIGVIIFRFKKKEPKEIYGQLDKIKEQIFNLKEEELISSVDKILSNAAKYRCEVSLFSPEELQILAPHLKRIFVRCKTLECLYTRLSLRRSFERWNKNSNFWIIGQTFEHALLLVKEGHEKVFEGDGSKKDEREFEVYPSVLHLILFKDKLFGETNRRYSARASRVKQSVPC